MKKILISLLLPLSMTAMAQVVEVNVSALSEEGSNERVGVVLKKDAETAAFVSRMNTILAEVNTAYNQRMAQAKAASEKDKENADKDA